MLINHISQGGGKVSECWMFYALPTTSRVIFMAKTSLDFFSLG